MPRCVAVARGSSLGLSGPLQFSADRSFTSSLYWRAARSYGVVRDKGFGFIRDDRGQDLFFHRSAVEGYFNELREGKMVVFEEEPSAKGPRAASVRLQPS